MLFYTIPVLQGVIKCGDHIEDAEYYLIYCTNHQDSWDYLTDALNFNIFKHDIDILLYGDINLRTEESNIFEVVQCFIELSTWFN